MADPKQDKPTKPVTSDAPAEDENPTGPTVAEVIVKDAAGEETTVPLAADDAALVGQRAQATIAHESFAQEGYTGNPDLVDPSEEEQEKDRAEYEKRFGGGKKKETAAA